MPYPDEIVPLPQINVDVPTRVEPSWWNRISTEVDRIKTELGVNPSGVSSTVADRFSSIQSSGGSGGKVPLVFRPTTPQLVASADGNWKKVFTATGVDLTGCQAIIAQFSALVLSGSVNAMLYAVEIGSSGAFPNTTQSMFAYGQAKQLGRATTVELVTDPGPNKSISVWCIAFGGFSWPDDGVYSGMAHLLIQRV